MVVRRDGSRSTLLADDNGPAVHPNQAKAKILDQAKEKCLGLVACDLLSTRQRSRS